MTRHASRASAAVMWGTSKNTSSGPGDAEFAAQWLQSALKADRLLQKEFSEHPGFRPTIERLEFAGFIEFAPAALAFISMWFRDFSTFKLDLTTELAEIFVTMADVGFFTQTGDRYQMTIPKTLRIKTIRDSLLKLAATEDAHCYLHPEWLLATMTDQAASDWQGRLSGIGWMQRVADRNALLAYYYLKQSVLLNIDEAAEAFRLTTMGETEDQ